MPVSSTLAAINRFETVFKPVDRSVVATPTTKNVLGNLLGQSSNNVGGFDKNMINVELLRAAGKSKADMPPTQANGLSVAKKEFTITYLKKEPMASDIGDIPDT